MGNIRDLERMDFMKGVLQRAESVSLKDGTTVTALIDGRHVTAVIETKNNLVIKVEDGIVYISEEIPKNKQEKMNRYIYDCILKLYELGVIDKTDFCQLCFH